MTVVITGLRKLSEFREGIGTVRCERVEFRKTVINEQNCANVVGLCLMAGAVSVWALSQRPKKSTRVIERYETTNDGTFRIRVTSYAEDNGGFVPGAYYVFESSQGGATDWHEVITFRHDDRNPIPRHQIIFLDNKIAFLFMGWMYAVTKDGGATWNTWTAEKDLSNWECCNYQLIQSVNLQLSGTGIMTLDTTRGRRGVVPELRTNDYGEHWAPP